MYIRILKYQCVSMYNRVDTSTYDFPECVSYSGGRSRCNPLQHTATHCNTLRHTATHCDTLRYTATHCNTLQHRILRMCVPCRGGCEVYICIHEYVYINTDVYRSFRKCVYP